MFLAFLLLLVGLALLVAGAEFLVRGASSISKRMGVPALVIGLTIVAFGTSAPELVVNLMSAIQGSSGLALGNIIGSNIANIFLILGVCALIRDLKVQSSTTWKEIPFAVLAIAVVLVCANDVLLDGYAINALTRTDGLLLLGFFAIFLYYTVLLFKRGGVAEESDEIKQYGVAPSLLMIVGGLAGLFFGGQLLVEQATILAKMAGLSDLMIGLTVVAIGTSLPELATSAIATKRGQSDIAIGNIVGSNIFNVFWILGVTSIISPVIIGYGSNVDLLVALGASLLLFVAMFLGKRHSLEKWQGALFLVIYVVYTVFLINRG